MNFILFFNTGKDDTECFPTTRHAGSVGALINALSTENLLMGLGYVGVAPDTYALETCDTYDLCALFPSEHHEFIREHAKDGWAGIREVQE
jgi:hypothetical protein